MLGEMVYPRPYKRRQPDFRREHEMNNPLFAMPIWKDAY